MEDCSSENSPVAYQHQSLLLQSLLQAHQQSCPEPQREHHRSFLIFQPLFCLITNNPVRTKVSTITRISRIHRRTDTKTLVTMTDYALIPFVTPQTAFGMID